MILATGGTGVIGSELLRLLSQEGVPHARLVRNPKKAQNYLESHGLSEIWLDQKHYPRLSRVSRAYFFSPTISKTW